MMVSYYLYIYIFKCVYHVHCHFYKPKLFSGMVAADNIEHVAQVPKPVTTARSGRIGGTSRRLTTRAKATTKAGALGTVVASTVVASTVAMLQHLQAVAAASAMSSQCLVLLVMLCFFENVLGWWWRFHFSTVVCVCVFYDVVQCLLMM